MRRISVLVLAGVAACSGGGDSAPVTPPPTPTIALALTSSAGTVARGGTATTTVSLSRGGGYTGTVALAAAGAPSGVQVSFEPASLTGSATSAIATVSVGAAAAAGTSTITFSASGSGVNAASTTYALTIPTPTIGVSSAVAAVSMTQGTAANVAITVSRTNGYADAIALSASGLPDGATATFTPASVPAGSTSSTLVFAVPATTTPGTYPVTITASGTGVTSTTAAISLTVIAAGTPAFGLSASPAAIALTAGESAASTITAARSGGFAADVALSVTGEPAGMTATFSAATIAANSSTSTLTVATTTAITPGTYTLTVNGSGTGVTAQSTAITVTVAAPPGVTVSAIDAQQLSQGTSSATAIPIVLTRTGGLAGNLTMSLEGAPAGVTATFAPNPATGSGTQMTLAASATAVPGTYTLTVRATGAGGASGSRTFALTVTAAAAGSIAINAVPSTLSVVQGQTGLSTINIARAGGFTGAVTLTVTGLPAGTVGTFAPASPTGTQSQLGLDVGANTAPGSYTLTIRGQGAGVPEVTTTLSLTVTPAGGGTGNINWRFCDADDLPMFVAFRAGTTGAWTRVTPASDNTYSFTLNGIGSVVIVRPGDGGVASTFQYNFTATEMATTAQAECTQNPASKTLMGTVAGLTGTQGAEVSVGGGTATVTAPATSYTITDVSSGVTDLLAFRTQTVLGGDFMPVVTPDRAILRRNVNYAAGSNIPVLDFNGAEAFAPASATYTLSGAAGGEFTQILSFFNTANGTSSGFFFGSLLNTTGSATVYGVPSNRLVNGDYHFAMGIAGSQDASMQRAVFQFNRELVNRTLTLGPQLAVPTVTTLGTAPYARLRSAGTWQTEYADAIGVTFSQGTSSANTRSWTISQSRGFATGAGYQLDVPDLSGTSGWNNSWGLVSGAETTASTSATGGAVQSFINPAEGAAFRQASRTTRITP